ncbi:MAG TPA: hypothetical protein VN788_14175 [Verrucomicrobiae bacterium]|nr:hypothetical protein [Verrucomicrobiae bacterium]
MSLPARQSQQIGFTSFDNEVREHALAVAKTPASEGVKTHAFVVAKAHAIRSRKSQKCTHSQSQVAKVDALAV